MIQWVAEISKMNRLSGVVSTVLVGGLLNDKTYDEGAIGVPRCVST
jgi:hypothetical protein